MSILSIAESVSSGSLVLPVAIALSLLLAAVTGVFRSQSAAGRAQAVNEVQGNSLLVIAAITFLLWLSVPALYGAIAASRKPASSTQPVKFTPAQTVGLSLTAPLAGIIGALVLCRRSDRRLPMLLGFDRGRWWAGFFEGIAGALIVVPVTFGVSWLTQAFFKLIEYQSPTVHPLLETLGASGSPLLTVAIIVSATVVAPLFEELLFRGLLQTMFLSMMGRAEAARPWFKWVAIAMVSVLFTLVHSQLWMMPPIFFLSVCLGIAYERSGNLWTAIVLHACFNAVSTAQFLASR
jgi:membrane protease YdiL (CAAX protease family)